MQLHEMVQFAQNNIVSSFEFWTIIIIYDFIELFNFLRFGSFLLTVIAVVVVVE